MFDSRTQTIIFHAILHMTTDIETNGMIFRREFTRGQLNQDPFFKFYLTISLFDVYMILYNCVIFLECNNEYKRNIVFTKFVTT